MAIICIFYGYLTLIKSNKLIVIKLNKHVDGIVQDCNISSALVIEILQPYTKPLMIAQVSV